METLSAISVAALTLVISVFFLAYTQKEKLNPIYHYLCYLFIAASIAWGSFLIAVACFNSECTDHHCMGKHHYSSEYHEHMGASNKACPKCKKMMQHKMNMQKDSGMMMQHMHRDSMQMMNNK